MRRTKIVCTIGPASRSPEMIERLIEAGMNVARLNFSHGSHDEHGEVIGHIRSAANRLGKPVAILQDIAGPKIRIGAIAAGEIHLQPGQQFTITNRAAPGSAQEVSVNYSALASDVRVGDTVLLSDGALELAVERVEDGDVVCRVVVGGPLTSHKGLNLLGRSIKAPILTPKDREDIAFGVRNDVDFMALSFVRTAKDVEAARDLIRTNGGDIPIIAKIEKQEAVDRIDDIIPVVDGIMVARGDLGVNIPIEQVPAVQKKLIHKANMAAKPVITATQMLRSMVDNPRPTRAEVTDVANAILDGSDAIMLSEETAVGSYAIQAVGVMNRVANSTELAFPYLKWTSSFDGSGKPSMQEAVAHSACRLVEDLAAEAAITCTQSGSTTRLLAKYRPSQKVVAMTPDERTYRRLALTWGAHPVMMQSAEHEDEIEDNAMARAIECGLVKRGDVVVITAGYPLNMPGTTNWIRIIKAE